MSIITEKCEFFYKTRLDIYHDMWYHKFIKDERRYHMSRQADFYTLLPLITKTIEQGGRFPLKVSGTSMEPFLHDGEDTVYIEQIRSHIRIGDILFVNADGKPILHRVSKISEGGFELVGDNQIYAQKLKNNCIIGAVYECERNGKKRKANTSCIRFLVSLNRLKMRVGRALKRQYK